MAIAQGRNCLIKIVLPATSGANPTALTSTYSAAVPAAGGTVLGNLRSWSVDETVETVDATTMSTSTGFIFRDVLPSFKSWTATADVLFEDDAATVGANLNLDINEALFRSGETVNVFIYPEGESTTSPEADRVYYGKALITSKAISSSYDGLIEVSITFEGRSTLFISELA